MENEKSGSSARIEWIDIYRGLAMVFVIFGHIAGYYHIVGRFVYLFHVPAFFFLSGYLFSDRKHFVEFLWAKIRTLLLPFLLFSFTMILFNFIVHALMHSDYPLWWNIRCTLLQRRGEENRIWFLPCLFASEILLYLMLRVRGGYLFYGVFLAWGWLNGLLLKHNIPWSPDTVAIGMSFMIAGLHFRKYQLEKKFNAKYSMIVSFIICCTVYIINKSMSYDIDMADNMFGDPLLFYAGAFSGIVFLYSVSVLIHSKQLVFIGQNTITFLCMNSSAIKVSKKMLKLIHMRKFSKQLYYICSLIMVLAALWLISLFVNRYIPFYAGKKKKAAAK